MLVTLAALNRQLIKILASQATILYKLDVIMSEQQDIDTQTAAIEAAVNQLGTDVAAIIAEIAALKAENPAVDTSALDAAVTALTSSVSAVSVIPSQ